MRKTALLCLIVTLLGIAPAVAQKYACVNTDYVLKSIPDYTNAQKRLEKYVEDWSKELAEKQSELDEMRAALEQESYLLPDNLKKRRREEIAEKENEIRQLQQQRFGAGGDLDKKQAELLKPVQDRVFSIIEKIAHEKNYAFVFDKSASSTVLFANKKYDISDDVLELLGVKPGQNQSQSAGKPNEAGSKSPSNGKMPTPNIPSNNELNRPSIDKAASRQLEPNRNLNKKPSLKDKK